MPKLIRELRMGPTKSFKTGAVVGTYPKPLLCLQFDEGGIDIIPSKGMESGDKEAIKFDITSEDIVTIKANAFRSYLAKPMAEQPKVLCIDLTDSSLKNMSLEFKPLGDSQPMQDTVDTMNALTTICNWKTIVFDPLTGFQQIMLNHIAKINPNAMADARQWAGQVGQKVQQMIGVLTSLPCHVVLIAHTQLDKNEMTGAILELPNVYGKVRESIGELFSQVFYSTKQGTKPQLWSTDQGFVRGIGTRWPVGLPAVCNVDFNSIYGKETL